MGTKRETSVRWRLESARPGFAAVATGAGLVAILLVGVVDVVTGPDIGMSLFYVLPIMVCGWWVGLASALICAATATAWWLGADIFTRHSEGLSISLWNGFTRAFIYSAIAVLTSRVRLDRDRLKQINQHLHARLAKEKVLARTDALTGLANSRHIREILHHEFENAGGDMRSLSVAYIDIDNFKKVNDIHGHAAGDDFLRQLGAIIHANIREGDSAGRIGGDEFVLLFRGLGEPELRRVAQRLLDRACALDGKYPNTQVGVSIGIAHFPQIPGDYETAVRLGDDAMYEAKRAGKRRLVLHVYGADGAEISSQQSTC